MNDKGALEKEAKYLKIRISKVHLQKSRVFGPGTILIKKYDKEVFDQIGRIIKLRPTSGYKRISALKNCRKKNTQYKKRLPNHENR
ncbi:hypothetical protein OAK75_00035 [Bacteriovoracales bacterium]|nr:hypothetical protein [Bacteriovoracales bacterium]